jgi:hypothetical protein
MTVPAILCVHCRAQLYLFRGVFEGCLRSSDFEPIPPASLPQPGSPMLCHRCHRPWYLMTVRGSPLVMTTLGWRPSSPKGPRRITLPSDPRPVSPSVFREKVDFIDPSERHACFS